MTTSMVDQDLYKLTTGQFFFLNFHDSVATYKFKNRSGIDLTMYADLIKKEIQKLEQRRFTEEDITYLRGLRLFTEGYLSYLKEFRFYPHYEVQVWTGRHVQGGVEIIIIAPLCVASMYEIFILSIVQEIYGKGMIDVNMDEARKTLKDKSDFFVKHQLDVMEFGTRRRHSFEWQDEVIKTLADAKAIDKTSNMYFARKYGLKCSGTMPHELYQACQAAHGAPRLRDFQTFALRKWYELYEDKLAIALTDIVGMSAFLRDFDTGIAVHGFAEDLVHPAFNLYNGCRHDSGDPEVWTEKLIQYYQSHGIDPKTKIAVYSDGLNPMICKELKDKYGKQINVSFGIGTNLTNHVGYRPLQIVVKMVECDGQPCAKLSDSPGKGMCESVGFENYLKETFCI
jgi:nicotinate phosphoribosyltransferase